MISSLELENTETTPEEEPTTEAMTIEVEEISKCYPKTLSICSHLPYNMTTYPNLVGHTSKDAILKDLVAFRELLDAECSHLAQVCYNNPYLLIVPKCKFYYAEGGIQVDCTPTSRLVGNSFLSGVKSGGIWLSGVRGKIIFYCE